MAMMTMNLTLIMISFYLEYKMIDDVTVIGDVHGCYKTLLALLDKIPEEHKKRICFAGDLIDRGPKSKEVVEFVIENGHDCVAGNHELMMGDFKLRNYSVRNYSDNALWLGNGGTDTRKSYCYPPDATAPHMPGPVDEGLFVQHQLWMKELPIYIEYPNVKTPDGRHLVVSHSIIHPYWKNLHSEDKARYHHGANQTVWGRCFHKMKDQGFFNVIGHTPEEENPRIRKIYANIDTGAFIGYGGWKKHKRGGLGKLTALHVPTMTVYQQECIEDEDDIITL
jgi:serine/threonine protein phosphatase 1